MFLRIAIPWVPHASMGLFFATALSCGGRLDASKQEELSENMPTVSIKDGDGGGSGGTEDRSDKCDLDSCHDANTCFEVSWTATLQGEGSVELAALAMDPEGNILVAGTTTADLTGEGMSSGYQAFYAKLDALGEHIWVRQFGGDYYGRTLARALVSDSSGNIWLAGELGDRTTSGANPTSDMFVRKVDSQGQELWSHVFGYCSTDKAFGLVVDSMGQAVVVGMVGNHGAIRKLDSQGEVLWTRATGGDPELPSRAHAVAVDDEGAVYVGGSTAALLGDSQPGEGGAFLQKFDASGQDAWGIKLSSEMGPFVNALATDSSGNIFVASGHFLNLFGKETKERAFLSMYDALGELAWSVELRSAERIWATGLATHDCGVSVIGAMKPARVDGVGASLAERAFLHSYDREGSRLPLEITGVLQTPGDTVAPRCPPALAVGELGSFIFGTCSPHPEEPNFHTTHLQSFEHILH